MANKEPVPLVAQFKSGDLLMQGPQENQILAFKFFQEILPDTLALLAERFKPSEELLADTLAAVKSSNKDAIAQALAKWKPLVRQKGDPEATIPLIIDAVKTLKGIEDVAGLNSGMLECGGDKVAAVCAIPTYEYAGERINRPLVNSSAAENGKNSLVASKMTKVVLKLRGYYAYHELSQNLREGGLEKAKDYLRKNGMGDIVESAEAYAKNNIGNFLATVGSSVPAIVAADNAREDARRQGTERASQTTDEMYESLDDYAKVQDARKRPRNS